MMDEVVVFSIDNAYNMRVLRKFLKEMDNHIAMSRMKSSLVPCIGFYKGRLEYSFILGREDFDRYVNGSDWIENQESFLAISTGEKGVQYATLITPALGTKANKHGQLVQINGNVGEYEGWTYRPDMNVYWGVNWKKEEDESA